MKTTYTTAMLIMALSLVSACSEMVTKEGAEATAPAQQSALIAEARQGFEQVNELGNAWRDTEELIQEAEKALQAGDAEKADKLASEAIHQNKMAMMQYEREKSAAPLY